MRSERRALRQTPRARRRGGSRHLQEPGWLYRERSVCPVSRIVSFSVVAAWAGECSRRPSRRCWVLTSDRVWSRRGLPSGPPPRRALRGPSVPLQTYPRPRGEPPPPERPPSLEIYRAIFPLFTRVIVYWKAYMVYDPSHVCFLVRTGPPAQFGPTRTNKTRKKHPKKAPVSKRSLALAVPDEGRGQPEYPGELRS